MPWSQEKEEEWAESIKGEGDDVALEKLKTWLLPQTNGFFRSESGERLHVRAVLPRGDPDGRNVRASIFFCHGMNGHVNAKHVAVDLLPRIADKGFAVFAMDIVGHGYSDGERSLVQDWQAVFDSFENFAMALLGLTDEEEGENFNFDISKQALARVRQVPVFVVGESMGGMIGMYVALRMQQNESLAPKLGGAVLLCSALAVSMPNAVVQAVLRNLVVPLFKYHEMPAALSSSAKPLESWSYNLDDARQREIAEMQMRDCAARFPDVGCGWGNKMLWGTAGAFSTLFSSLAEDMEQVNYPLLLIHDEGDKVCYFSGSQDLFDSCASQDKKLEKIDIGGLHAIMFVDPDKFLAMTIPWIMQRL